MNKEIFKDVPGYDKYQVSNLGRVKSFKLNGEKILKPVIGRNGYFLVKLYNEEKVKLIKVHQLVAMAFLNHEPCGHKIVVDHKNNDKLNNRLENLQLISQRENSSKDKNGGTSKYTGVNWHKASNGWVSQITINGKRKHLGSFPCELEASKHYQAALKSIEEGTEIKAKEVVCSSKYKGVNWHKQSNKWMSKITVNGKSKYLGIFNSELAANEYYQDALRSIEEGTEVKINKHKKSSKYKGVCWSKQSNKWKSQISINGKRKSLGLFSCELAAHHAYQKKLAEISK
jgi:hypothetical protein